MLPYYVVQFLIYTFSMNFNGQCTQNTCELLKNQNLKKQALWWNKFVAISQSYQAKKGIRVISGQLMEIGFDIYTLLCQNGYIISTCTAKLGIFQSNNLSGKQERKRETIRNYEKYWRLSYHFLIPRIICCTT